MFNFATANLTLLDTINGGDGTDTINITDDADVVDADFTLVTNTETLTSTADEDLVASLGSLAAAAGIVTVTFAAEDTANDSLTVEAGYTGTLTVNLDADYR